MRQKVLQTKPVNAAETGLVVAEEIGNFLTDFGIFDKIVAVTVDNALNMDLAIKRLQFVKLGCFAQFSCTESLLIARTDSVDG